MTPLEALIVLLLAVVPLVTIARRVNVAYPIVLIAGGVVAGLLPGLPHFVLPPSVVLTVFLPPLVYWEAITAPTNAIRANARSIGSLALGLVLATAAAVAAVAHRTVPELGWAPAFVLGAVVSPTDELAFLPIAEHLRLPRRVMAIIEGESLLNDATALVIYAVAVRAVSTGRASFGDAGLELLWAVCGAIALGMMIGRLVAVAWSWIPETELQGVLSLTLPYVAYLSAERLRFSGVLCAVVVALVAGRRTPRVLTPRSRSQLVGFWQTAAFVLNVVIYMAAGFELPEIFRHRFYPLRLMVTETLLVSATVILVRIVWVAGQTVISRRRSGSSAIAEWKGAALTSWSGLRGGVSLAAALAVPTTTAAGTRFPGRELFIAVTYGVMIITMVGQGLTLPILLRRLRFPPDDSEEQEELKARREAIRAAMARVDELAGDPSIPPRVLEAVRQRYERRSRLETAPRPSVGGSGPGAAVAYVRTQRAALAAERARIIELREQGQIDNTVMRHLQEQIDLEDLQLDHLASHNDIDDDAEERGGG